jgi:thiamine-phosphate pyrophosphorylase
MITDRTRLGAAWERSLVDRIAAAAGAGVHLIQIRERDLDGRSLTALTRRAVEAVAGTPARVLVNDRVDVALAAGAHGVHLRADSVAARRARAMAPPSFVLGRSVHSLSEALDAQRDGSLDYLLFGTVFETSSKPGAAPAGIDALRRVAAAATLPVLAIGGITVANAPRLAPAGAAGLAAIGMFAQGSVDDLAIATDQACRAFDTLSGVP